MRERKKFSGEFSGRIAYGRVQANVAQQGSTGSDGCLLEREVIRFVALKRGLCKWCTGMEAVRGRGRENVREAETNKIEKGEQRKLKINKQQQSIRP